MKFVGNRSFLLLKPKQPFIDWVNGYDENEVSEENIYATRTLYMIDELDDVSEEGVKKHLKKKYEDIVSLDKFDFDEKTSTKKGISKKTKKIARWIYYRLPFRKHIRKLVNKKFEKKFKNDG